LTEDRTDPPLPPIVVPHTELSPDALTGLIESFVLREGTDYGLHETSLEAKVAQVLLQLRRGGAHITFDPATESINVVVTSAIGSRRPCRYGPGEPDRPAHIPSRPRKSKDIRYVK
jgi:uncharacterized protein